MQHGVGPRAAAPVAVFARATARRRAAEVRAEVRAGADERRRTNAWERIES